MPVALLTMKRIALIMIARTSRAVGEAATS